MKTSIKVIAGLAVVLVAWPLAAQQAGAGAAAPPAQPAEQQALEENLQDILEEREGPDSYQYDPQGRRDPFRSLIGPLVRPTRENVPPGPPGFMIDEIDLMGIVRGKQGLTAMIKGPDNNGWLVRAGDKVFDGEVIRITASSIVFRQEVNDPTRIERFREVVKELVSQQPTKP